MKHQNVYGVPSKNGLLNAIELEILNNLDYYGRFLEADKDCVKEAKILEKIFAACENTRVLQITLY